jgi:hypothetical protein
MKPTTTLDAMLTSNNMMSRSERMLSPPLALALGSTMVPGAGGGVGPTVDTKLLAASTAFAVVRSL